MINIRDHGGIFGGNKKAGTFKMSKGHARIISIPLENKGVSRQFHTGMNSDGVNRNAVTVSKDGNYIYYMWKGENESMAAIDDAFDIVKINASNLSIVSTKTYSLAYNYPSIIYSGYHLWMNDDHLFVYLQPPMQGTAEIIKINPSTMNIVTRTTHTFLRTYQSEKFMAADDGTLFLTGLGLQGLATKIYYKVNPLDLSVTEFTFGDYENTEYMKSEDGIEFIRAYSNLSNGNMSKGTIFKLDGTEYTYNERISKKLFFKKRIYKQADSGSNHEYYMTYSSDGTSEVEVSKFPYSEGYSRIDSDYNIRKSEVFKFDQGGLIGVTRFADYGSNGRHSYVDMYYKDHNYFWANTSTRNSMSFFQINGSFLSVNYRDLNMLNGLNVKERGKIFNGDGECIYSISLYTNDGEFAII